MRAISSALIAVGLLASCDSPAGPTGSGPVLSGIQMFGPAEIPPGHTAEFSLFATSSDATTRDVTNEATWSSGDGQVAFIAKPGHVAGREQGTVTIEARFGGQRARREVHVLPAGTYKLTGYVHEQGDIFGPVIAARIEAATGAGDRLVATSNADGVFFLYGLSGETTLQVTKRDYSSVTQRITLAGHRSINISMSLLGKYPDLGGTYSLTIAAAGACGIGLGEGRLPEELRVRSYKATIEQKGRTLWVVLGDNPLQGFYGTVESDGAAFAVHNPDDGQPIGEQLSASTVLTIEGKVSTTINANRGLAGQLAGELRLSEIRPWKSLAWCSSASHQFVLTR